MRALSWCWRGVTQQRLVARGSTYTGPLSASRYLSACGLSCSCLPTRSPPLGCNYWATAHNMQKRFITLAVLTLFPLVALADNPSQGPYTSGGVTGYTLAGFVGQIIGLIN